MFILTSESKDHYVEATACNGSDEPVYHQNGEWEVHVMRSSIHGYEQYVYDKHDIVVNTERPHHYGEEIETRYGEDYHHKAPKRSMYAKVKSRYYMVGEPTYTLLGASGIAYGWKIKKLTSTHYEEQNFGREEEAYDYAFV